MQLQRKYKTISILATAVFVAGMFAFRTPARAEGGGRAELLRVLQALAEIRSGVSGREAPGEDGLCMPQLPDTVNRSARNRQAEPEDPASGPQRDSLSGTGPAVSDTLKSRVRDTLNLAGDTLGRQELLREIESDLLLKHRLDSLLDTGMDSTSALLIMADPEAFVPDTLPQKILTAKELKKIYRDSVRAYKDSVIRATPRLLDTYLFPDSVIYRRMFVWKADPYLNRPEVVNPDTTYNENFSDYPYMRKDVNAVTLGVSGSPVQFFNYFKREELDIFPFASPYLSYSYTPQTMRFYNVKSPYTELAYWGTLFANKQKEETNVEFLHTQNFTPAFNFNILYKRYGGAGILEKEKTDNRTLAFTANYLGKRYVMQGGYIFNRIKRTENGGISDLSMFLDTIVDARTIPVALQDAKSQVRRNTVFITQSYGIPFRIFKRDTLGYGEGTMAYVGHSGEFSTYSRYYTDVIGTGDEAGRALYGDRFFINPTTSADSVRVMQLENKFFLRLQPWAREAIVSKLDAGVGFQYLSLFGFEPGYFLAGNRNRHQGNLYVYFGASGQFKRYFSWEGFGRYNLAGYYANDFAIDGQVRFSAYPLEEGIHLTGKIHVSQKRPNYFYNHYYSNHYIWDNDFAKTTETRIEGKLEIPHWKLEAFFGYSLLADNVYFDTLGMAVQNNEPMSILTACVQKNFRAWKFHFDNQVLFQLSSRQEVVPLPKLALRLRYYLQLPVVKDVLTAQLGVEGTFNTKYYMPAYSPALGLFHNQDEMKLGNNPYLDVFVNLQWKRASIFVKYVNAAQDWPKSNYFSAYPYLKPQTAFKLGIHWPFYIK